MAANESGAGGKAVMHMNPRIEQDRRLILDARAQGRGATFKAFLKLSGPGWLQSGITVGGVSFSSSLFLGVLTGYSFLWLQPVAMIMRSSSTGSGRSRAMPRRWTSRWKCWR